jgi:hypothetical protein
VRALFPLWLATGIALLPFRMAQGQHFGRQRQHESFWLGVTGAYGKARRTCDQCNPPLETWSGAGTVRAGGTMSEQLLLGAEIAMWFRSSAGIKSLVGNISMIADWFPFYGKGLNLKGGAGVSIYQYRQNGATLKGTGLGLVGGVAYDIMVGRRTAIAPVVNFRWGNPGKLKLTSGGPSTGVSPASGANFTVLEFGLGLTFY